MKNYLVLLLTLILMVGCTEVEDIVTDNETESQEASTVDTEENSKKKNRPLRLLMNQQKKKQ